MRLVVPGVLLGTALLLVGGIGYAALAPFDPVVVETPRLKPRAPAAPAVPYAPPPMESFADIDARPLFSMHRQPLTDLGSSAAMGAASDFVLAGVIMSNDRAVALLRNKTTQATVSAAVGDLVDGWRVARIDATTVTLRSSTGEFVVPLDGPANSPPSAPLQPATPMAAPVSAPPPSATTTPPPAAVTGGAQTPSAFPLDPIVSPNARPGGTPPPKTAATTPGKPGAPAHPGGATIAPEALRGAPVDPTTGEPTL